MKNNRLVSIIYYTSNREKPEFEQRIRDNILKVSGGLPVISVSQKPINFGKNICVGDVGTSGFNCFRQILIAAENATTKFVVSAEADCMYPPDYFQWIPPREDISYRNSNLYVMPDYRDYFFHKPGGATHAQIVGREFYIKRLKELFKDAPMWSVEEKNFPKERWKKEDVFDEILYFETKNPVVQIKTHSGMRFFTRSDRTPIYSLSYWGEGRPLRKWLIKGINYEKPF